MSKNVLVTGGNGFIGSHVVESLIKKKYKVTVFDLKKPKRKDIKFIKGSILNKPLVNLALKKIDIVFHLAAMSDINKVKNIPTETIETNILGTTNLLEASKKQKIKRFIFASSIYSYGYSGNLYTTSKIASELIVKNYNLLFGLNYTIFRYSTAYGPGNRSVDAISIFVKKCMKNQDITIFGDGLQKRNYIYVKDLAQGSMIGLQKKTKNKVITLASSKNIKITELAKIILKLTNSKSKIKFNKKNKRIDDFTSSHNYNKIKNNLFGWRPKYNLKQGLIEYISLDL